MNLLLSQCQQLQFLLLFTCVFSFRLSMANHKRFSFSSFACQLHRSWLTTQDFLFFTASKNHPYCHFFSYPSLLAVGQCRHEHYNNTNNAVDKNEPCTKMIGQKQQNNNADDALDKIMMQTMPLDNAAVDMIVTMQTMPWMKMI